MIVNDVKKGIIRFFFVLVLEVVLVRNVGCDVGVFILIYCELIF